MKGNFELINRVDSELFLIEINSFHIGFLFSIFQKMFQQEKIKTIFDTSSSFQLFFIYAANLLEMLPVFFAAPLFKTEF